MNEEEALKRVKTTGDLRRSLKECEWCHKKNILEKKDWSEVGTYEGRVKHRGYEGGKIYQFGKCNLFATMKWHTISVLLCDNCGEDLHVRRILNKRAFKNAMINIDSRILKCNEEIDKLKGNIAMIQAEIHDLHDEKLDIKNYISGL